MRVSSVPPLRRRSEATADRGVSRIGLPLLPPPAIGRSLRRATEDEFGTEPYAFMGAFKPTSIEGARPMSVTGDLANAMPAEWFEVASRAW